MLDATDVAWAASSFTARYAVVYETTGGKIRAIYDFGADYTVTPSAAPGAVVSITLL